MKICTFSLPKLAKFLFSTTSLLICSVAFSQTTIVTEAESATLSGDVSISTNANGYSGNGFVYMASSGKISLNVNVSQAGFYKLNLRVSTPFGNKDQELYFNGSKLSDLKFPSNTSFFDFNAGNLRLQSGNNSIEIVKSWGYMYFDKFTLSPVPPHDYSLTASNLVNPNSTQKTKDVFTYLRSNYGKNIISGQTAYWNELVAIAGKTPVVRAFDFQHYTVGYSYLWKNGGHTFGWEDDGTTQEAINWYNSTNHRGIVSFQWHWHSPFGGNAGTNTFYTDKTNFDVSKAVSQGTAEYTAVIRDIDSIASQLKKLQNAGVSVLWRPLHEAGGTWFWWGAKGSTACLQLYDMVYDRLTNYHNLNNLIWVWSTPEPDWYPGNSKVDIIGYDSYPGAYNYTTQKSIFDQLFDIVEGKKMIAMTENGPLPNIDNCIADDAMWLYYSSWVDLVATQNTTQHIQEVFAHSKVITLDEVSVVTSTQDQNLEIEFDFYPTPASDFIHVKSAASDFNIEVIDMSGNILISERENTKSKTLNIEKLASGAYIIKIYSNQFSTSELFVKE